MASTFTSAHALEKPEAGDQSGVWGDTMNTNFDKIDAAIGRFRSFTSAEVVANVSIATSTGDVADFDSAIYAFNCVLPGNRTVTFPQGRSGVRVIDCNGITYGSNELIFKVAGGTDVGVTATSATDTVFAIYTNGTSLVRVNQQQTFPFIIGEIRAWAPSGGFTSSAQLPTGWHICNGGNGTPDLRNRFIYGTSSHTGYSGETKTGGAATDTVNFGTKVVVGNTNNHTLTQAQLPSHEHKLFGNAQAGSPGINATSNVASSGIYGNNQNYDMGQSGLTATLGRSGATGSGQGHNHGVSISVTIGSQTVDTVPPFYRVIFIQYTGV